MMRTSHLSFKFRAQTSTVLISSIQVRVWIQERIKGTEKTSPIHTLSIGNSCRVIFKTTDPKGD